MLRSCLHILLCAWVLAVMVGCGDSGGQKVETPTGKAPPQPTPDKKSAPAQALQ